VVAFSEILKQLVKADPRIEVAGYKAAEFIVTPVPIANPDQTYDAAKKAMYDFLNDPKTVNDDTEARVIFWAYQNLEVMAKWTRCHYFGQSGAIYFVNQMNDLERKSLPWITVVDVTR
jgi:hypothetical protein